MGELSKRVNKPEQKEKVKTLTDKYEKQMKSLMIVKVQQQRDSTNNSNRDEQDNNDSKSLSSEDDGNTIMSGITCKTKNSIAPANIPKSMSSKESKWSKDQKQVKPQSKEQNSSVVLKSLGSTRKARSKMTNTPVSKVMQDESSKNKRTIDEETECNDDNTIMSEITKVTLKANEVEEDKKPLRKPNSALVTSTSLGPDSSNNKSKQTTTEDVGKEKEGQDVDDNKTIMSDITKQTTNEATNPKANAKENHQDDEDDNRTIMSDITKRTLIEGNKTSNKASEVIDLVNEDDTVVTTQLPTKKQANKTTPISVNTGAKVTNPYSKSKSSIKGNKDGAFTTASYLKAAEKTHDMKNTKESGNENSSKGVETSDTKYIRIRFQFTGKHNKLSKNGKLKEILHHIMKCAKIIDKDAALMPWENNSKLKTLNGLETRLVPDKEIKRYIDTPTAQGNNLTAGRVYYNNGIRIKTTMDVYNFVEDWNNKRYDKSDLSPFKEEWKPIKRVAMQRSATAHPIGYFISTTERGDYDTICNDLEKKYDKVELSYQTVYQPGISSKVWEIATNRATEVFSNTTSKAHRQIKFSLAPSALTVFVSNEEEINRMTTEFINQFGELNEGSWPRMMDGSRMRFIPIIPGFIDEEKIKTQLQDHLTMQALSKSGEIKFDLNLINIHEKQQYLKTKA